MIARKGLLGTGHPASGALQGLLVQSEAPWGNDGDCIYRPKLGDNLFALEVPA